MKCITFMALVAAVQATPWIPAPRPEGWWLQRHEANKNNSIINGDRIKVIFYGDSITDFWNNEGKTIFESKYVPLGVTNYGISADGTEHLLYRINGGEVANLTPKFVVLKIGTNNIGYIGDSTDDTVRGVRAVVDLLLEKLPNTKILLLGLLPRGDGNYFPAVSDVNIKISKFEDRSRVFFLDMFDQFAAAWDSVDAALFVPDKLHLSTPGYQKWADTMDHLFNELYSS